MSMNIHMRAELKGEFRSNNGKIIKKTLTEHFNCFQTPTVVTKKILASEDRIKAYSDWVFSNFDTINEPVYDPTDFFNEKSPIAYREHNDGENNIKELNKFLEEYKDWDIIWYEM